MKKFIAQSIALASVFAPAAVFAAQLNNVNDVVGTATNLGNTFITILISFAVIWIIWNIVRYLIMGGEDAAKRAEAGNAILYGVIGLVVILSIWGLVRIFRSSFVTNDNVPTSNFPKTIPAPQI